MEAEGRAKVDQKQNTCSLYVIIPRFAKLRLHLVKVFIRKFFQIFYVFETRALSTRHTAFDDISVNLTVVSFPI